MRRALAPPGFADSGGSLILVVSSVMEVFVAISTDGRDLSGLMNNLKPEHSLQIGTDGQWLVCAPRITTSFEMWLKLSGSASKGDPSSEGRSLVICPMTAFYGYTDNRVWQWIRSRAAS